MKLIHKDVELRPIDITHAKQLFDLTDENRAYLRKTLFWVDYVKKEEDSKNFIENTLQKEKDGTEIIFEIWYQNIFVGMINFHNLNQTDKSAHVGYWIAEAYQRKGITTAACKLLVEYGFREHNFNRIEIHCLVTNIGSGSVAKKLGFQKEGILRKSHWVYDHFEDMEVWGLLKEESSFE